jgi:prepilin-type N-terminal cleavage/methylation domain-containing protein
MHRFNRATHWNSARLRDLGLCHGKRSRAGFTLVEIMIVVVIIGLLAAMGIPAFQRVQRKSRASAFVNDLKKIEDVANMYAQEYGSFPPDVNGGIKPPELVPYLTKIDFTKTPLGGAWDWDNHAEWYRITGDGVQSADALVVDQMIDDGNLETGHVQYDGTLRYYLAWR